MTDLRKAAEMALEALDYEAREEPESIWIAEREALRQALAHEALDRMVAENERLGLYENTPAVKSYCGGKPNYCTPEVTPEVTWDASAPLVLDCPRCGHCCQQRKWVGLDDDKKIWEMWVESPSDVLRFARAIEAKLKEKNT